MSGAAVNHMKDTLGRKAQRLERMMAERRRPASVLAIASGKGGVGKTSIAVNLSLCLAAAGKRIVLFDADMSLGNVDIMMNITSRYNIAHLLGGSKTIEEIIHIGPKGLEIVCGGSGLEDLANVTQFQRQRLVGELGKLQTGRDAIIIDTGAGISRSVVGFCLAADHVLVVTTPEAAAMTDAYGLIKVLAGNDFSGRISVIVNMAETTADGKAVAQQIARVARQFLGVDVDCAAIVLRDEKLRRCVRMRKCVVMAYPRSPSACSIVALAAKLSKGLAIGTDAQGFFRKVVNWFF